MITAHAAAYGNTPGNRTLITIAPGLFFSVFSTKYAFITGLVEYSTEVPKYVGGFTQALAK